MAAPQTKSQASSQSNCPCSSGTPFATCCEPFLKGKQKAKTAEDLLRSRYTAFATGDIDYVWDTHHSKTRKDMDRKEIESWAKGSDWHGLEIVQKEAGETGDSQGTLIFCAKYADKKEPEKIQEHWEKSFFEKEGTEWRFLDAQGVHVGTYRRSEPKTGRNDPCPCGSGKKFKKCHASTSATV